MNTRAATWLAWSTCLLCVALLSAKLSDEPELDRLNAEMLPVARGSVQPFHASLWLRPAAHGAGRGSEAEG